MEITLSTGKKFTLESLRVAQCRRADEAEKAGKPLDAHSQACVDAINNAGGKMTASELEEALTPRELNELFNAVLTASGMAPGETQAAS